MNRTRRPHCWRYAVKAYASALLRATQEGFHTSTVTYHARKADRRRHGPPPKNQHTRQYRSVTILTLSLTKGHRRHQSTPPGSSSYTDNRTFKSGLGYATGLTNPLDKRTLKSGQGSATGQRIWCAPPYNPITSTYQVERSAGPTAVY